MTGSPKAVTKGVEFSDRLIVLGGHPMPSHVYFEQTTLVSPLPPSPPPLPTMTIPKAPVFVRRGENAIQQQQDDSPLIDDRNRTLSSYFEHTVVDDYESESGVTSPPNLIQPEISHSVLHTSMEAEEEDDDIVDVNLKGVSQQGSFQRSSIELQHQTALDQQDDQSLSTRRSSTAVTVELPPEDAFERSTRINTKLNSLPSGGAFSLMNSSEDVNSSSQARSLSSSDDGKRVNRTVRHGHCEIVEHETDSETSSDEEDPLSPRRMVRVDGSARLSSASGLNGDDFDTDEDEDEFGIEGAERVEEEEAIQVRSFGRAFARVCLKDGTEDKIIPDPRRNDMTGNENDDERNGVAFANDSTVEKKPSGEEIIAVGASAKLQSATSTHIDTRQADRERMAASKSTPPRRKSRLRITFTRRSSAAGRRASGGSGSEDSNDGKSRNVLRGNMSALGCFPNRRTMLSRKNKDLDSRTGALSTCDPGIVTPVGNLDRNVTEYSAAKPPKGKFSSTAPTTPEEIAKAAQESAKRKIVKNISLQRDDWIDFATNAAQRQRQPWLIRLVSSSGNESTASGGRYGGGSGDASTTSTDDGRIGRRKWRIWRRD